MHDPTSTPETSIEPPPQAEGLEATVPADAAGAGDVEAAREPPAADGAMADATAEPGPPILPNAPVAAAGEPRPAGPKPRRDREPKPRVDLDAVAAELKARFAALFAGAPKPIKLRVQADIQARAPGVFTKHALSLFLHRHTTSTLYLIALSQQPQRFDLDGQPAGDVAAEHRDAAAQEVERRRALRREREAQMQQARRAAIEAERERAREQFHQQRAQQRAQQREQERERQRDLQQQQQRQQQAQQVQQREQVQQQQAAFEARREDDQARRDRARLLRDFDSSPLTKNNFCVLKGIRPDELEAQLLLARREAAEWVAAQPPRPVREERAAPGPQGGRPATPAPGDRPPRGRQGGLPPGRDRERNRDRDRPRGPHPHPHASPRSGPKGPAPTAAPSSAAAAADPGTSERPEEAP